MFKKYVLTAAGRKRRQREENSSLYSPFREFYTGASETHVLTEYFSVLEQSMLYWMHTNMNTKCTPNVLTVRIVSMYDFFFIFVLSKSAFNWNTN